MKEKITILIVIALVLPTLVSAYGMGSHSGGMGCGMGGGMHSNTGWPMMHHRVNTRYSPSAYDYGRSVAYYPSTYEERLLTRNTQETTSYNPGNGVQHSAHH